MRGEVQKDDLLDRTASLPAQVADLYFSVQSEFVVGRANHSPACDPTAYAAHKYDQRLAKCIGVLVAKHGEWFYINWCLVAHDWVKDPEFSGLLTRTFHSGQLSQRRLRLPVQ